MELAVGESVEVPVRGMGLSFFEMSFAKKKRGHERTAQQALSFSMLMV